jgi:hypothetical protein
MFAQPHHTRWAICVGALLGLSLALAAVAPLDAHAGFHQPLRVADAAQPQALATAGLGEAERLGLGEGIGGRRACGGQRLIPAATLSGTGAHARPGDLRSLALHAVVRPRYAASCSGQRSPPHAFV